MASSVLTQMDRLNVFAEKVSLGTAIPVRILTNARPERTTVPNMPSVLITTEAFPAHANRASLENLTKNALVSTEAANSRFIAVIPKCCLRSLFLPLNGERWTLTAPRNLSERPDRMLEVSSVVS